MKKKILSMFVLLVFLVPLCFNQSEATTGSTDGSAKNYKELLLDWSTKKIIDSKTADLIDISYEQTPRGVVITKRLQNNSS